MFIEYSGLIFIHVCIILKINLLRNIPIPESYLIVCFLEREKWIFTFYLQMLSYLLSKNIIYLLYEQMNERM